MRSIRFARFYVAVLFTLLAGALFAPSAIHAQDSSSMTGVVTDATGAILPDVTVTLTNKSTGVSYTQTTNKQGTYHFANVAPADGYTAVFSRQGFASEQIDHIALSVGLTRTQDAKLGAGATQVVEVSALNNNVTLDTTDASIGNNMDVQTLNELPVYDRTGGIATLFVLQPGVDSNMGAVTGARDDQTEVTVDGVDVNDIAAGTTFGIVGNAPVDSIEQFTGTVAGLVPGVGTGSGGQFQLVTKHGTNQFHGNVNEYHRDTTTEANTYFNNLVGVPRTPLIRNQFGGNVGGPILKDKLFFFFEFNDSRIIQSSAAEPTVPMGNLTSTTPSINYINDGENCSDSSRLNTTPGCISQLPATGTAGPTGQSVQSLDPQGIGFDSAVTSFLAGRYPAGNDPTQGDGVNTEGYRFTEPTPDFESTYIGRVDYNLTKNNKVFGRFTINRENAIQSLQEFPTDPVTHPFIDRSYGYVVSDVWTIGKNKVNQFSYGDNISKYDFPDVYNPTGANQYSFSGLSGPYTGFDGQVRRVPIPVVRDDFNWQLGNHSLAFGGTFKFIKADSNLINDFNAVSIGAAGPALGGGLGKTNQFRPSDIFTDSQGTALTDYDNIFADSLGVIGQITTNFNYTAAGTAVPAGTGGPKDYRYFETEAYVSDNWKLSSKLTISYGLRYQVYSVPYETHGEESVQYLDGLSVQQTTLNAFFKDRIAQIAAENVSPTGLPNFNVTLGGKANNKPGFYAQSNKDFAPRLAFAYSATPKIVVNGGAGIVYDRTVINTINFLQNQVSYLFSNSNVNELNDSSVNDALTNNPRVGSGLSFDSSFDPAPQPVGVPYTPFVAPGYGPYGDQQYQENFIISPNLKDPYSIALNFGVQQDLPWNMVLKINYVGRLGRRLLADADAGQILDNPDISGLSNQTMVQAFAGLTTQERAGTGLNNLAPEPWFENVLPAGAYTAFNAANPGANLANNTQLVAAEVGQYANRGDMGEALNVLEAEGQLPFNVGTTSQFTSDLFLVNQGNSNYHGLLVTLDKNMSHGLGFGFNYTWSHAIDNTSQAANNNAAYNNFGFICDITKPKACRGSADFDVRQEISSNVVYNLPIGHGQQYLATSPIWVNEAIGGWSISALPAYRTGLSVLALADAYLASSYNQVPSIFTGDKGDLKAKVNVSNGTVWDFAGGQAGANKVLAEFRGPVGLEYGQRNLFKGPGAFTLDMGLAKVFPIIPSKNVNLKFRADGFNLLNHPNFGTPNVNLVGNAGQYGQITGVSAPVGGFAGARVAQFSLRLEF